MKKDKKYRQIKAIMNKYYYRSKIKYSTQFFREHRLAKLLDNKVKPLDVFGGVPYGSKEHKERMKVFRYFEKLGYKQSDIVREWRKVEKERWERQKNRIY